MQTDVQQQQVEQRCLDVLASTKQISADDCARIRDVAQGNNIPAAVAATELGLVDERFAMSVLSKASGIELAQMTGDDELPEALRAIGSEFFFDARVVPIGEQDGATLLAVADPYDDFAARAVEEATGRTVQRRLAAANEIESALTRVFRTADIDGPVQAADEADRLKDLASAAPAVRYLDQLLREAVDLGATDIHIEPHSRGVQVRVRKDGALRILTAPSAALTPAVISRIKIISGLDVAERRLPQDGRVKLSISGKPVDFRISTIPMLNGESVVMRILDQSARTLNLDDLGFAQRFSRLFKRLLKRSNGIILVTGPTGSGKTTTLYAALSVLTSIDAKIITVEDPVEYQVDGVAQMQVDSKTGLNFARSLRSVLRHDPDIIMIGEIRDLETATIAIQAALTGHLVLATLHANSAASAITRLRDIGIQNFMLTSVINGVVAQRLIRTLCPQCKQIHSSLVADNVGADNVFTDNVGVDNMGLTEPASALYRAVGCGACTNGYEGRRAISELLIPDEEVTSLILRDANHLDIEEAACAAGMIRLADEALSLCAQGVTTLEEATRVAPRSAAGEGGNSDAVL